jgi:hypothetical protein
MNIQATAKKKLESFEGKNHRRFIIYGQNNVRSKKRADVSEVLTISFI